MSRIFAAVLAAGVTMLAASAAEAGLLPARVEDAAKARVAAGQYPALAIAMVDGDKSEISAFGTLDDGRAPDGDTVFEIGSITKTFTATLLADAVQSGRVTLDEPMAELLPDFTIPARGGKQITLEEIGARHSGLPRMPANFSPADPANPFADYDAAKLKAFLASYQLTRDPGASYEYSNLAFGLLGDALAASAHTDYGALAHDEILAPLGMTMSGTRITPAMRAHLAPGHDGVGKPAKNWDFDAFAGAGAIKSTANDMLRYLKANTGVDKTPLAAAMTLAHTPRADMTSDTRIGLAWMTTAKGIVWHNGTTGGYMSFIGFTTDGKRGVIVLANAQASVADLGMAALDNTARLAPARKTVVMSDAELDIYSGTYKLADNFNLRIFRIAGQLYLQATGQGPFPLFRSTPNEFFVRIAPVAISFIRDTKGVVTGLVLHQNGDRAAPRLPDEPIVALDAAALGEYVGKYQLAPGRTFDIMLKDGQLLAQLTGQPAFPVYVGAKDKFFYKVVDARIDFERGGDGKVAGLVLHQSGKDMRAPRVIP